MKQTEKEQSLEVLLKKAPQSNEHLFRLLQRGRNRGFENFINRKLIWPYLVNLKYEEIEDAPSFEWKDKSNRKSQDYQQLEKDAERSLSSMRTFENVSKIHLKKRQEDVLLVLDSFFVKHPQVRYIQGFHDVASIFLMVFGNNIGYYMLERAGKIYFHDFLKYDVGHIGIAVSSLVLDLLLAKDQDFRAIFDCFKESKFLIFIIPWIFTWFSHVFSSVKTTCRIWDYILSTGPFGAIYLTAGIILSTKQELLDHCGEQFDEANIQTFYQKMAQNESIDIEAAIRKAIELQDTVFVQQLEGYQQFKADSMFRFENFYPEVPIIQKYNENEVKKRNRQRNINNVKNLAIAAGFGLSAFLFYKYGGKNLLKTWGQL